MKLVKILALVGCLTVSGCAELKNRGGAIDWLEDRFLFVADSKKMRVLRSYIIAAGLTRVASKAPATIDERKEIVAIIKTLKGYIDKAKDCADNELNDANIKVVSTRGCAFFDDRMASIDYATLRLARAVFMPEENKDLLAVIRRGLSDQDGLFANLDDVLDTAGRLVDAGSGVLKIGSQTLGAGAAILRLASNAFKVGGRLTPIYRDSVELEMQVALDSLKKLCEQEQPRANSIGSARFDPAEVEGWDACRWHAQLSAEYGNGSGDYRYWRHNVALLFKSNTFRHVLKPEERHFKQVEALMVDACADLVGKTCFNGT